jgi:transcriptional regulator with XRE-family HTH domain
MTSSQIPQQRRRLGLALRGLRLDAGLSGQQLAVRTGLSQSTISRIELGQAVPSFPDIDAWAHATAATAEQHSELRTMAEAVAVETISWPTASRRGLSSLQQDVRELESTASIILNYQPTIVPGLLQTADYARRVVQSGYPSGRSDIAAAITARLDRQALLYEETRHLEFVIAELALRWRPGPPAMMLAQLDRIASVATLPNVAIWIIPQTAEVTAWYIHGFAILDGRGEGSAIVRVETLTTGLSISDPEAVERYRQAFELLRQAAVTGNEAQRLIHDLMIEMRNDG